jgi:hypothetical protein
MALINFLVKLQTTRKKAVVFLTTPMNKCSYFYFPFTCVCIYIYIYLIIDNDNVFLNLVLQKRQIRGT